MRLEDEIKSTRFGSKQQRAILNVLFTASWVMGEHGRLLKPFGISPQQYNVLRILRGSHPNRLTVRNIKERMLDKTPNVTRLVDKLIQKDWVARERCNEDRRVVFVTITEAGLKELKTIDAEMEAQKIGFGDKWTEEEADRVYELMESLRH